MHWPDQICDCRRLALCALLCFFAHAIAISQTDTSTPPKPATPSAKQSQPHSSATKRTSHASAQKSKTTHGKKVAGKRGQQAIDPLRAREIQTALIREHYLQGQPTGTWDSASQAAMQKYQADHGWQSKTTPDARALITLGLGPSQDHLLNPESAMTATNASADKQSGSAHATTPDRSRDPAADPVRTPKTAAKPTPADSTIPKL